jgi:hypothetical protein
MPTIATASDISTSPSAQGAAGLLAPPRLDGKSSSKPQRFALTDFDLYPYIAKSPSFRPIVFFVGILIGFISCAIAGRIVANRNSFENFQRFHTYLNPTTFFYPTVSQMVSLVEAKTSPEQTIVILGGNSIFYGLGQNSNELWSIELQKALGPHYAVFNFALPQALPFEGAYWAAESLLKRHRKVIYATVSLPGLVGTPFGSDVYGYAYWDARDKHLACHDLARDVAVDEQLANLDDKEKLKISELRLRSKLDSLFYFEDLWNTLGYTNIFTVWTAQTAANPLKARKEYYSESFFPPPVKDRFNSDFDFGSVRTYCKSYFEMNTCTPRQSFWTKKLQDMTVLTPFPFKRNCLVFVATHVPAYLDRLMPVEKSREQLASSLSVEYWKRAGYFSTSLRGKLLSQDFLDSRHLVASGGKKVASIVASEIISRSCALKYEASLHHAI